MNTTLVIRLAYLLKSGTPLPTDTSMFLHSYDPHADDGDEPISIGGGVARFTKDLHEAMKFPSREACRAFVDQIHPLHPLRLDGKPNRPLSAYCIEFIDTTELQRSINGWERTLSHIEDAPDPTIIDYTQLHYLSKIAPSRRVFVKFKQELTGDPRPPHVVVPVNLLQSLIGQFKTGNKQAERLTTHEGRKFNILDMEHIILLPVDAIKPQENITIG